MTPTSTFLRPLAAALLLASLAAPAYAEKADREKPINLEADRMSMDDINKVQVYEGNVILTQGTLQIRTAKLVVTQDADGFQKGVATGGENGLARFRQKREGKDEWIDGEAERIEYNTNSEIAELFHRAWVKSGEDQVKGDYIWYDAISEKYLVTAGEARDAKAGPARVRAVIQPKSKGAEPAQPTTRSERLDLRGSGGLSLPNAQ